MDEDRYAEYDWREADEDEEVLEEIVIEERAEAVEAEPEAKAPVEAVVPSSEVPPAEGETGEPGGEESSRIEGSEGT